MDASTESLLPNADLMKGKKGLIMGIANDHSMAYGIAREVVQQGAEVAVTYQGEGLLKRVKPLADSLNANMLLPCDVEDLDSVDAVFAEIEQQWGKLDFVVHALAYADRKELKGAYLDTSRENFAQSMRISCFSLTEVCQRALPLMSAGGSIITLSFIGSQRTLPDYNVMGVAKAGLEASVRYLAMDLGAHGVRINTMSPGPMRTISGAAISSGRQIFNDSAKMAPLKRNATMDETSRTGLYLLSDLSSGVTGTIHYVDGGFHAVGLAKQ